MRPWTEKKKFVPLQVIVCLGLSLQQMGCDDGHSLMSVADIPPPPEIPHAT